MVGSNHPKRGDPASILTIRFSADLSLPHHWKNRHPSKNSFVLPESPVTALLARQILSSFFFFFFFPLPLQGNTCSTKTNPPVHSLSARWLPTALSTTWRQLLTTVLSTTTAINISNSTRNGAELEHAGRKNIWKGVILPSAVRQRKKTLQPPSLELSGSPLLSRASQHHPGIFTPKDFLQPRILPTGTVVVFSAYTFLSNQCLVFESKG